MGRALIACRQSSCAELVEGGGFCVEHKRPAFADPHRVPLPPDWYRRRARVLARDSHRCTLCGARATNVDHIIARARGGSHDMGNLRSLCSEHASEKDAQDAVDGRSRPVCS